MANLNSRLVLRNDILTNWESLDEQMIPFKGEALVVFDGEKTRLKIGDGIHSFNNLPWFGESGDIEELDAIVNQLQELTKKVGNPSDDEVAASGLFAELDKKADIEKVYTKEETDLAITSAIAEIKHFEKQVLDSLPDIEMAQEDTIYLVPFNGSYNEYLLINGKWELIGSTVTDLEGYVTNDALNAALENKVDKVDGQRLITEDESDALAALMNGEVGTIKLISIDGIPLEISEDKSVDLPIASLSNLGVVKGADKVNQANITENGEISVNNITFDHIVNGTNEVVINCGNAFGY